MDSNTAKQQKLIISANWKHETYDGWRTTKHSTKQQKLIISANWKHSAASELQNIAVLL
jgi:hypothetical protein